MVDVHRIYEGVHRNTTGNFVQKKSVGRPSEGKPPQLIYEKLANFVFTLKYHVKSMGTDFENDRDKYAGWLLDVCTSQGKRKTLYISVNDAMSKSSLSRVFSQAIEGCISKLSHVQFMSIIEADQHDREIYRCYMSLVCGKVNVRGEKFWLFPESTLDSNGNVVRNAPAFIDKNSFFKRDEKISIPRSICTPPASSIETGLQHFATLCQSLKIISKNRAYARFIC